MADESMTRLRQLYDPLIEAMFAAHSQPDAHTRAKESEARQAYQAALHEVFG